MIRDELKTRRDRIKAAAAKEKARRPSASKRTGKSGGVTSAEQHAGATPVKRRSRKQADVPAAA